MYAPFHASGVHPNILLSTTTCLIFFLIEQYVVFQQMFEHFVSLMNLYSCSTGILWFQVNKRCIGTSWKCRWETLGELKKWENGWGRFRETWKVRSWLRLRSLARKMLSLSRKWLCSFFTQIVIIVYFNVLE